MKKQTRIIIHSYNPYEARFPGLRVVSRDVLHLMKQLREAGYEVIVTPDNGTKLHYVAKKGLSDFLSDPVVIQFVGMAGALAMPLIKNWLTQYANRSQESVILKFNPQGSKRPLCPNGRSISEKRLRKIERASRKQQREYQTSLAEMPPDPKRPTAIYLEHTGKIVGWCKLELDEVGMKVADAKIIDEETARSIQSGVLIGYSVGGLVEEGRCTICDGDYALCNHISGKEYGGNECTVEVKSIRLADVSVVRKPAQPLSRITMWKGKRMGESI